MPKKYMEVVRWKVSYLDEEGLPCSSIAYDDDQLILIIDTLIVDNIKNISIIRNEKREGMIWR